MTITMTNNGEKQTVFLSGRLDTAAAAQLEKELAHIEPQYFIFDFSGLLYISAAGLRVLLTKYKKLAEKDAVMVIKNPNALITSIFDDIGFSDILTIERD